MKITGKFDVQMKPLESSFVGQNGITVSRMSIDKTFKGALSAHSQGEMISAVTETPGSAAYVAIEQVTGTLSGKSGSFVLQHAGRMDQGAAKLTLETVPDSATDELQGLRGTMQIRVEEGQHHYDFEYVLPEHNCRCY